MSLDLILPDGLDQLGIVEPVICPAQMASTGASLTAQTAYFQLVRVTKAITVTKLSCYTSAATANVDMSIMDAALNEVANLSAAVAAAAGGLTTGNLVSAFTYQPGIDYYHGVLLDASVTIVRGFAGVAVILNAGSGLGTQRSLSKAVAANVIPSSIASPAVSALGLWIAGHN